MFVRTSNEILTSMRLEVGLYIFFVNASARENLDAANSSAALMLDSGLRYSIGRPAITER